MGTAGVSHHDSMMGLCDGTLSCGPKNRQPRQSQELVSPDSILPSANCTDLKMCGLFSTIRSVVSCIKGK